MPTMNKIARPSAIRTRFCHAISKLYQREVPLYSSLMEVVSRINDDELHADPGLQSRLTDSGELRRLGLERHGAIRLGTPSELATMARLFRVMGMHPVGYYDLSAAGVPVHATCFRPRHVGELAENPFRMFTSLLRLDLLPVPTRELANKILSRRQIFTGRTLELVALAEAQRGLGENHVDEFVFEAMKTFTWHSSAIVTMDEYTALSQENPLLSDVVGFPGPHINHLTPRTLNIDKVQVNMRQLGIPAKHAIEGPPCRTCPILLRQTSFKALKEEVWFPKAPLREGSSSVACIKTPMTGKSEFVLGDHKARFGEIEQRGAALTRKGLQLYNTLLGLARDAGYDCHDEGYSKVFESFPDTWQEIHDQGLAWFSYSVSGSCPTGHEDYSQLPRPMLEQALIKDGLIVYEPIVYEDFLPVSAAGIFQSNLGTGDAKHGNDALGGQRLGAGDRVAFEAVLQGFQMSDPMVLYERAQQESMEKCLSDMGLNPASRAHSDSQLDSRNPL